jgi:hypothetical protein
MGMMVREVSLFDAFLKVLIRGKQLLLRARDTQIVYFFLPCVACFASDTPSNEIREVSLD